MKPRDCSDDRLEFVDKLYYLDDIIRVGTHSLAWIRIRWKKFKELMPLLARKDFSLYKKQIVGNENNDVVWWGTISMEDR